MDALKQCDYAGCENVAWLKPVLLVRAPSGGGFAEIHFSARVCEKHANEDPESWYDQQGWEFFEQEFKQRGQTVPARGTAKMTFEEDFPWED